MWTWQTLSGQSAASAEEPVAQQPLSPVRLSPAALQQARAIQATTRQTVHVGNAYGVKGLPGAELPRLTSQAVTTLMSTPLMLSRIPNWSATRKRMPTGAALCHGESQRLASAQRHDAIREAAKLAVLASVQADIDSVVQTDACCPIRRYFSQEQEQRQQQQSSTGPAPAAATLASQDKAVRYVGLAADGEVQLRSFSCMCCGVWSVMPEAVACVPATLLQPQTIFADQLLWLFHHLTVGDSAVSATAFCAALR